jgi:BirA family transcriptional regulator, biotin operon repressor / biotin---[acetyl-CoA-carboxylase] ligase
MSIADQVRELVPAGSRFGDVRWVAEADSTNRVVVDAARAGAAEGLVVMTDFQSAGRGRLDRHWEAPPGSALLLSVLLRPVDLPVERRHLLTAATGLAAREACAAVSGTVPDLKWPNDLLVAERKLAGILAESWGDAVVVGIGINVSAAPPYAAHLEGADRAHLAAALLNGLDRRLGQWDEVAAEYRRTCATIGRQVRIETTDGDVVGRAERIDEDGRLVVAGRVFAAGDVIHLRPAAE